MYYDNVLVIVDVQDYYSHDVTKRVIEECKRLIRYAKARQYPIVVVEFYGSGLTHQALRDCIGDYNLCFKTLKYNLNGATSIMKVLQRNNIKTDGFIFCGGYIRDCLRASVDGMIKYHIKKLRLPPKIHVVRKACYDIKYVMRNYSDPVKAKKHFKRIWGAYPYSKVSQVPVTKALRTLIPSFNA